MKPNNFITHEFVEYIPKELEGGVIYVSIPFATVAHKCCCGCGNEVITPLSPTDWKLIFNGESISLNPSIGNWNFKCKSHYWIESNRVIWARRWSQKEINASRAYDSLAKENYFNAAMIPTTCDQITKSEGPEEGKSKMSIWNRLKNWVSSK